VAYLAEHLHVTADAFLVDRFYGACQMVCVTRSS
jgi:hypothetical protein